MEMTTAAILKELKAGKYAPVYFLFGEEPYFIDQVSDFIEHHALQEHEKGFNQMILYGKDVDMAAVLGNARRFPMMAERQVVIVKEAQELGDFKKEQSVKLLEHYLQQPQPSTVLVFAYKHSKLDKRTALWKALSKQAVVMEAKKVYDNKLPEIIQQMVAEKGRRIHPEAVRTLTELIGANLDRIAGEINKTLINIKEGEEISNELVLQYVGLSKEFNVFELNKAMGTRDTRLAFRIIDYFEINPKNNPPIPVIINMFNYWTRLMIYHRLKNGNPKDVAAKLQVNPYFLNEYKVAARNYPLEKVIQNIAHLHDADRKVKGMGVGTGGGGAVLKELVYKLMY
jgi:DNA polymerase-3 subunit delta